MKTKTIIFIMSLLFVSVISEAQLTGEWTDDNGACYKIRQIENQIFWSMDARPRVLNVFMGYLAGNTITGTWADVPGGNMLGSGTLALRVESQNRMVKIDQTGNYGGSVWTRGACGSTPPATRPDLSGTWYDYSPWSGNAGLVSTILQQGNKLVFINVNDQRSDGYFKENNKVIATDWEGGLEATIEDGGNRIVWKNGSVWQRTKR
jgi:hypothetical protein